MEIPSYSVNTSDLGSYFCKNIKESTKSISSLFQGIIETDTKCQISDYQVKTNLVFQSEPFLCDLGEFNKFENMMIKKKSD